MKLKAPSETFESKAFARWLSRRDDILFSKIPIGDTTLTGKEGLQLWHIGVRPGVPDFLIVHIETKRVLMIEMKRTLSAAKLSDEQRQWLSALGPQGVCCYGFKSARLYTKRWLKGIDNELRKLRAARRRRTRTTAT